MKIIDAIGKQCPIPVIMAKKEIKLGEKEFEVKVDNEYAVGNLKALADNMHFKTTSLQDGTNFTVTFMCDEESCECTACSTYDFNNWAVFAGSDIIGNGDRELGTNLIRMFFYTLTQEEDIPKYILFMNSGVNLTVNDNQIIEHLKVLEERGSEILICGTCLNFYKIETVPTVGSVSNMYNIVEKMKLADKVITL